MSTPHDAPGAPVRRRELLVLGVILAFAWFLRIREAGRTPLWFDELFTLEVARRPLPELFRLLALDVHPPLPTLMVAGWARLGGTHVLWLKSLPLAIGLLTVASTWGFARRLFGPRAAVLAAVLLTVHARHIYFSQELRSYGLLALATVLAGWAAWAWLEKPTVAAGAAWVLAATLGLYTHYLSILVLWVLGIVVLASMGDRVQRLRPWLLLQVPVGVLFAPQLRLLRRQLLLSQDHWLVHPPWGELSNFARHVSYGSIWLAPVLLALIGVAIARRTSRAPALYAAGFAAGAVLVPFVLTHYGAHLYVERYMFFTLPLWCAVTAAGLDGLPWKPSAWIAAALLTAAGLRYALVTPPLPEAVQLHDATDWLRPRLLPGDRVYCADMHSLLVLDHDLGRHVGRVVADRWPLPFYTGAPLVDSTRHVRVETVRASAAAGERWWVVRTRTAGRPPDLRDVTVDSLARGPGRDYGMVRVWCGAPDTAASPVPR